ncbi:MAG: c(7)-type cytochrome triheme domain-containing protein [Waddliaceae bacterium]
MTWEAIRRKRSFYYIFALILVSFFSIYACARQAKSEPVSSTTDTVVAQAKAPVQIKEEELKKRGATSEEPSLLSPAPADALREFADPTKLPEPGAPYNEDNTNPVVVMKGIPKEATGVEDWVKAFKENKIQPHESLDLSKPHVPPFNFDVEIPAVGSMPNVIFPHFPHTFWLDCGNCHPGIFIMKKGGNPISMVKIVNGEFCGRCHGRVAFPIANCTRCHVKPK